MDKQKGFIAIGINPEGVCSKYNFQGVSKEQLALICAELEIIKNQVLLMIAAGRKQA